MTLPTLGMPFPGPLTPEAVSAVLRDPDEGPDALYPSRIGVFCDECDVVVENDFLVTDRTSKTERLEFARWHLRSQGWTCTPAEDLCPDCTRDQKAERQVTNILGAKEMS